MAWIFTECLIQAVSNSRCFAFRDWFGNEASWERRVECNKWKFAWSVDHQPEEDEIIGFKSGKSFFIFVWEREEEKVWRMEWRSEWDTKEVDAPTLLPLWIQFYFFFGTPNTTPVYTFWYLFQKRQTVSILSSSSLQITILSTLYATPRPLPSWYLHHLPFLPPSFLSPLLLSLLLQFFSSFFQPAFRLLHFYLQSHLNFETSPQGNIIVVKKVCVSHLFML